MYQNVNIDSPGLLWLAPLILWELAWKGYGLWRSAHHEQKWWFIAILVFNTLGILPIGYLVFFQKKDAWIKNAKMFKSRKKHKK